MMDRENVLKLETIQKLFNKFFRKGHRFFGDVLDSWITHPDAKKRLFGITRQAYNALAGADKETARTAAREQMEERYGAIFRAGTTAFTTAMARACSPTARPGWDRAEGIAGR